MINPENLSRVQGKLIALVKEIYLNKPSGDKNALKTSFFEGKKSILLGTWALEWWITKRGMELRRELAEMIVSYDCRFSPDDEDSVYRVINSTLQQNALNSEIFNSNKVLFPFQAETLFEARAMENVKDFFACLWSLICTELENSVNHWLVVYPLHKVSSSSFDLGFDEIQVLNSDDYEKWQKLTQRYSGLNSLDLAQGSINGSQGFSPRLGKISCWIICCVSGTEVGTRKEAERRLRTFLALLFSYLEDKQIQNSLTSLLSKSRASPWQDSIQFSEPPASRSIIRSSIGILLPPLLCDANVLPEDISNVRNVYIQKNKCSDLVVRRMTTASHFLHYAIVHDDLERFLHFFFALDAMFGERGKVEQKIVEGIEKVFLGDETWKQRTEWLFELRSELVHGGVSQIRDWKKFDKYKSHFKSNPLDDVKIAAMTALKSYPSIGTV
jgi:hypothetical protein